LRSAEVGGRLRLHVRIDERSAGFVALGLAKITRRPVPVVTTSGTAVANLHPAVIEADQSGVSLVVLSADRPPELRGTGANQTIDQLKIFGAAVREFVEMGAPDEQAGNNGYWRSVVCRLLSRARGDHDGHPGPVHVNLAFREPLADDGDGGWPEATAGRPDGKPWTQVAALARQHKPVDLPQRTLVVVGDCSPQLGRSALHLAEERGWPVVSEPSGNARSGPMAITTGGWLLTSREWWESARPEQVLVVGRPTISRAVAKVLAADDVSVHVVAEHGEWADSTRTAQYVHQALPIGDGHHRPDSEWLERWLSAEQIARATLDATLDKFAGSEQHFVRALTAALPADALLVAGSSLAIRHAFLYGQKREGLTTVANRGSAGIDGTVSTAWGAAAGWQAGGGGLAVGLMGDLTFLHDTNGLMRGRDEVPPDMAIVVLNNDGGGVFEQLEHRQTATDSDFERVLGTPHGVDLAALCGATSTPFTRVSTSDELTSAVLDPRDGLQVVEVRTERRSTVAINQEVSEAVFSAMSTP
ncbi:MAG: 2-succinyl-5-enolpyruvyl-6-hydroxy-3-cyclohexene-1-carboxylic-acid synthase, partial [Candidatus Nanopelagicales bacterium]